MNFNVENLNPEVLHIQLSSAIQEVAQAKKNLNLFLNRCAELENELAQYKQNQQLGQEKEIEELSEISKLRRAIEAVKHEKNEAVLKLKFLEEKIAVLQSIDSSLREQLKMSQEEAQFNLQRFNEIKHLKTQNLTREAQIRKQLNLINEKQSKFREFAVEMMSELSLAIQTNPNQNLLKITEFELSKVENQLKKTPTSDTQRKALEVQYDLLVEQRDFLFKITETSNKMWAQKLESLKLLLEHRSMEELPPLPPVSTVGAITEHEA